MLKKEILRNKKEFSSIYRKGKSVPDRYVVLFVKKNNLGYNRTAFLASKKVGNSVQRNRAKRLMKESYRFLEGELRTGYDMILVARNSINGRKFSDVDFSIRNALKKLNIMGKRD